MAKTIRFCFRKEPLMAAEWLDMALGLARAGGGSLHTYPITPSATRLPQGPTCLASKWPLADRASFLLVGSLLVVTHHQSHQSPNIDDRSSYANRNNIPNPQHYQAHYPRHFDLFCVPLSVCWVIRFAKGGPQTGIGVQPLRFLSNTS
jgi:hypothetical protein